MLVLIAIGVLVVLLYAGALVVRWLIRDRCGVVVFKMGVGGGSSASCIFPLQPAADPLGLAGRWDGSVNECCLGVCLLAPAL